MKLICQKLGLRILNCLSKNGNCQFNMVKAGIGLSDTVSEMRKKVADFISHDPEARGNARLILNEPPDINTYIQGIRNNSYGDHSTLAALTEVYKFNYTVLCSDNSVVQSVFSYPQRIYLGLLRNEQHYVLLKAMVKFYPLCQTTIPYNNFDYFINFLLTYFMGL